MTHLELENLASDYLEGLLEAPQKTAVEAHLAECMACGELLKDLSHVLDLCRAADDVEPKPWLISKIIQATIGERKPTWGQRIADFLRPVLQPRVAYPIAMTVFTFSILVNAAGLNLRSLQMEDLNPRTWVSRATRQGHLMEARAEKFYFDLRVVYEIESRFRQLSGQSQVQENETPKSAEPDGGSSQGVPSDPTRASNAGPFVMVAAEGHQVIPPVARARFAGTGRSLIQ